jgi:hypothetical protein
MGGGVLMRKALAVIALPLILLALAGAQVVSENGKDRFETEFVSGGRLRVEVRSGDVRITGTDSKKISVHYEGRDAGDIENTVVHFKRNGESAVMHLSGGPRNNFHIRIEIPRETELKVRMPFGQLEVEDVRGSKDVEIHAGQLMIDMGDANDYGKIETSVSTGELSIGPLGVEKGGLFRSYEKDGAGKFRLYAHVGAGELDVR